MFALAPELTDRLQNTECPSGRGRVERVCSAKYVVFLSYLQRSGNYADNEKENSLVRPSLAREDAIQLKELRLQGC